MVISTRSWHYRWKVVLERYLDAPRKDCQTLCGYFWRFVGVNLRALTKAMFTLGAVLALPMLLWSAFHNHSVAAKCLLIALAIFFVILFLIFAIESLATELRYRKRASKMEKSLGFGGVVVGMISATKNKVCPLITYTE